MALGLFFLYAGLMGVTMSIVFLVYDLGSVAIAFGVTTGTFAIGGRQATYRKS